MLRRLGCLRFLPFSLYTTKNSLWYAKDRLAMRALTGTKNPDGPADPIICHPDVRKMLLTQKAISEGGRAMLYECALLSDQLSDAAAGGDEVAHKHIDDRMGFLTPILKGFLTELGCEAANLGIQVRLCSFHIFHVVVVMWDSSVHTVLLSAGWMRVGVGGV